MPLSHIKHWVFDLDNTLYAPEIRLFDQIEALMEQYITRELGIGAQAAKDLRADFWHNHGTTLAGLMANHGIDPDGFLDEVHDIDLTAIEANPDLHARISALDGQRIIYTNGSRWHGENVSTACGLKGLFHGIYGIEDADYRPKPEPSAFEKVFARAGVDPSCAIMFEDDPRNLIVPAAMGMVTVLVGPAIEADHIHYQTTDLAGFLADYSPGKDSHA